MKNIQIRGARTHNLKNIDVTIPRDKLVVITGLSGSGKSSLAFDTIYAEGKRRYVESLSSYARQFLSVMEKPDIDHIEGLSPAISIEQKSTSHNPRSTVGTVTEIYDYLRLLFARVGTARCPQHDFDLQSQTVSQMVDHVMQQPDERRMMLLSPLVSGKKGEHSKLLQEAVAQGFIRARIDGELMELNTDITLDPQKKHDIDIVIDRFKIKDGIQQRLAESIETGLQLSNGLVYLATIDDPQCSDIILSENLSCHHCGYSMTELEPRIFSFNNPKGACNSCDGLGMIQAFDPERVVAHPELSLPEGAIRGWERKNSFYYQMLTSLSSHYGFDLDTAYQDLDDKIKELILYGSGKQKIEFHYHDERKRSITRKSVYEGIINNMLRRYNESESASVRDDLSKMMSKKVCVSCSGTRLCQAARHVFISQHSISDVTALTIDQSHQFFSTLKLSGNQQDIASRICKEISLRLKFLLDVGLNYLSLDRSADTLSGGEAQRIRLASQIGSGLMGVMYILDEPSIGLHQRDNQRLIDTLTRLRDLGNTVIVVEHDEEAIRCADHIIDMGPGAGVNGGEIVATGNVDDIINCAHSLTGQYLSGKKQIEIPQQRIAATDKVITIKGARGNNLKDLHVEIPIGLMTAITGVSGSGKSTLINETLYHYTANLLNRASKTVAPCQTIEGLEHIDKIIDISQSPIGRTPRSNPATYTGIFTHIRDLFSNTPMARERGYKPGRFSFNVKGGRCESCQGDGLIKVEMHFLPDIYVLCDHCKGKRYGRETLDIHYKGKSIAEVLDLTIDEAYDFFLAVPVIHSKVHTLQEVGLGYIKLGQNATTLSGGEAQRIKLARELSKRDTTNTLYILDEPTTGLHFHDIKQLLSVLHRLRDKGNTLVVIEHNLDVIKTADWVIDLGPEGGNKGGEIVACGTPEDVAAHETSYTGKYLAPLLARATPLKAAV